MKNKTRPWNQKSRRRRPFFGLMPRFWNWRFSESSKSGKKSNLPLKSENCAVTGELLGGSGFSLPSINDISTIYVKSLNNQTNFSWFHSLTPSAIRRAHFIFFNLSSFLNHFLGLEFEGLKLQFSLIARVGQLPPIVLSAWQFERRGSGPYRIFDCLT